MSRIPHQKYNQSIQLQQQQILPLGCCFGSFYTHEHKNIPAPIRQRVCSQPKDSKSRKIDVTISKRRFSLTKQQSQKHRTQSRQRLQATPRETKKEHQPLKIDLGINFKIEIQNNLLRATKVSFNRQMDNQSAPTEEKRSWITTRNTTRQPQQNITQQDFSSFPLISQISLVEQQFVSQGSQSLKALNFIVQMSNEDKIVRKKDIPLQLSRISQEKQSRSSISRMAQFKKDIFNTDRKRLFL